MMDKDLQQSMREMKEAARDLLNEVRTLKRDITDGKPWEKHWTIIPRYINGRWYCREHVWRRFVLSPGGGFWRYGDIFDVLKDI